jgi:hypothetical protein
VAGRNEQSKFNISFNAQVEIFTDGGCEPNPGPGREADLFFPDNPHPASPPSPAPASEGMWRSVVGQPLSHGMK